MQITSTKGPATRVEADVLVVPLFQDEPFDRGLGRELDRALGGELSRAVAKGEVSGAYEVVDWTARRMDLQVTLWPAPGLAAGRVLFVGAGPRAEYDLDRVRVVAGVAARHTRTRFARVALVLRADAHALPAAEAFLLGTYEPDLHRTERSPTVVQSLTVVAGGEVRRELETARVLASATNLCRDLVNEPANEVTPAALAERAQKELEPVGVQVRVLRGKDLQRFGGLLAVAKGSEEPPVFITMAWEPPRARRAPVYGMVGKGITFDSGGLSLKPTEGMEWMKADMAGAAAVVAAMRAIAELRLPLRVLGAAPATENMPSGKATRVGDVIRHYSGKTTEVLNTDAEGRLVLADALAWIAEQGATHVVDVATLTGAIEIALGKVAFGVMGRPEAFVDRVVRASRRAGEKAWPLPLYPEYRQQLRSDIADLRNVGGRPAGSITAAWFLAEHVPPGVSWAHLDIAGVAWGEGKPHRAAGATGAGVRALVRVAEDLAGAPQPRAQGSGRPVRAGARGPQSG